MTGPFALPVAWDGVPVKWGPWESGDTIFICPPPKPDVCPECGAAGPRSMAVGKRKQLPVELRNRGPVRLVPHGPLHAFRCQQCGHDQVLDLATGQTWDLDITDYGPDGSWSVG